MRRIFIFIPKFFISILLLSMTVAAASAQSYNDNYDPARSNVTFIPPGADPSQGLPPSPGSGGSNNVATVTPGDQPGTNPPVPTGTATTNPQYGTYFNHQPQSFRSRVNLLVSRGTQTVNGVSVNRGTRVALTFQPDEIPDSKRSQIEGLVQKTPGNSSFTNFGSEPYQNVVVDTSTLKQIEKILYPPAQPTGSVYPYPGTPGDNLRNTPWTTRSYIAANSPAKGYPRPGYGNSQLNSLFQSAGGQSGTEHPREQIREFSHYLVIAGVVTACIQIVIAGAFMAFGHPYAGSKAIVAAGGLMLLLMAFSIWKVDMVNALTARGGPESPGTDADSFDITNPPVDADDQVTGAHTYTGDMTLSPDVKSEAEQDVTHPTVQLPAIPAPGTGQIELRSGLPLSPLGAAH
jgi:hypothetical protein